MDISRLIQISQIQLKIIQYEEPIILALSNIGNLANILTFAQRGLRKNVCSWYFICLSLSHLLLLNSFLLARIVFASTGYNISQQNTIICKLRGYAFEFSLILSRYFLCLISIDRWMVTSSKAWLREQSSPRIARRLIIISVIFWAIFSIHAPIGFQPSAIECVPPFGSAYAFYVSIENIVVSLTTMFVMSFFSLLTVINVQSRMNRQVRSTVTNSSIAHATQPTNTFNSESTQQRVKRNLQLVRLSLFQVLLYLFLNTTMAVFPLYTYVAGSQALTNINQQLTILFLGRLTYNLLLTYTAATFVIYTLASKTFRQQCLLAFKQCFLAFYRLF